MAKKGPKWSKTTESHSAPPGPAGSTGRSLKRLLRSRSRAPSSVADRDDGGQTESIRSDELPLHPRRPHGRAAADDGAPSPSASEDLRRVLKLIEDERHLVARDLYLDAKRRIEGSMSRARVNPNVRQRWQPAGNKKKDDEEADEKAWILLQEKQEEFQALESRANLFSTAKEHLSMDDDWIHAQTLFGISTSYRSEADGSLSVKIEGELHGVPLFEQLAVLRECDLYSHWAPFMSESRKLAQLDRLDVVAWFIVGVPMLGLTRDACYRAVGCDCMGENGEILLVAVGLNDAEGEGVGDASDGGGGVDDGRGRGRRSPVAAGDSNLVDATDGSFLARDAVLSTLEIPPVPEGLGRGRMTIRNFAASIDILAPTAARTKMVLNVDPHLQPIPQFMIDFVMKRMCGILLTKLQATARKVVKDPIRNPHARRIREDVRFYRDWLLPKFRSHCDEMGWRMPGVGAFEIEEGDLRAEGTGWIGDGAGHEVRVPGARRLRTGEDASCLGGPSSYAGTRVSLSGGSTASPLGRLKHLVRRSESQEDRIAEARLRAAERLLPEPFSESKAHRLNELKVAKQRAEEHLWANGPGSSSADSVSSGSTLRTVCDADIEDEVKRHARILTGSLTIHSALLLLRRYSILNATERTSPAARDSLDLVMVVLQAIALWALLNSVLMYSFDEIDVGQKKLVANMNLGRKLFVKEVKKLSRIAATSVAMASCGYGLAAGSFRKFCLLADIDVSTTSSRWWGSLPQFGLGKLLSTLNVSGDTIIVIEKVFFNSIGIVKTICRHVGATLARIISMLSLRMLGAETNVSTSSLMNSVHSMSLTHWKVCESREQWGSRALDISSLITLRLGVFVTALMLMGRILLPKPEKKARHKRAEKFDCGSSQTENNSGSCSVAPSLNRSGVGGTFGSMEIITEEES